MSLRAELLRFALRRFFKSRGDRPPDIASIRQNLEGLKSFIPGPAKETVAERITAGGVPAIAVSTPRSRRDCHVLYLHGGGYVYGSPSLYRDFIWRIADAARARVLCLAYRLAPEHPFPAAVDDAVAGYRALLTQGADPRRIAIMGDSAGGGLAFGTLLQLRDQRDALPAAAVALSPWTDLTLGNPSIHRNADTDPMINVRHAGCFAEWYLGGADPRQPYASPLHGDVAGLPASLILVGQDEVLHDDATLMASRLRTAGCPVELDVRARMPHVWPLFARVLPEGRAAIERIGTFLQARLQS